MRRIFGIGVKGIVRGLGRRASLWRLKRKFLAAGDGGSVRVDGLDLQLVDPLNGYIMYKDSFVERIYDFTARSDAPRILDCGANIGMTCLYHRRTHPRARITAFEPDPSLLPILHRNLAVNRCRDVEVVGAAVAGEDGERRFLAGLDARSHLAGYTHKGETTKAEVVVPAVRLARYLDEPVDLLKMNIEGAEWETLRSAGDALRAVTEMMIEYHHLPGLERTLHRILELLHGLGFSYLVHSFDRETNTGAWPPFRLADDSAYFLLIYARRNSPAAR